MLHRSIYLFAFVLILAVTAGFGQNADGTSPLFPRAGDKEDQPKGMKEQLEKLRIEKEKKDHDEMLLRGDQALKISEELEEKLTANAQLDIKDREKLESLEKILKKIRNELGGDDDSESAADPGAVPDPTEARPNTRPNDVVSGIRSLRSTTLKLVDELKKTTRFTISAAAIQTTNTVLRITRFLKFWN